MSNLTVRAFQDDAGFRAISQLNTFCVILVLEGGGMVSADLAEYPFKAKSLLCFSLYQQKWAEQRAYVVRKEVWGAKENRNAIRFQEEWQDADGQWYHSYGNEQLEFDEKGLIRKRFGCISDMVIGEGERSL